MMKNVLSQADLDALYGTDYYSYAPPRGWLGVARKLKRRLIDRPFIPRFTRLLEVGCGWGELLEVFKRRGDVTGLEISPAAAEYAAKKGIRIVCGHVEQLDTFPEKSFDYIYAYHSFEHWRDPNAGLRSCNRWLQKDGRLFLGIPNWDGLVARIFRSSWYYIGPPLHVTNSTPRSMRLLLQKHGFEIERIVYKSFPISIPASFFIRFLGTDMHRIKKWERMMIMVLRLICYPINVLLDLLHLGDCMEVHARKVRDC